MGLLDPNSQAYQDAIQSAMNPTTSLNAQYNQPEGEPLVYDGREPYMVPNYGGNYEVLKARQLGSYYDKPEPITQAQAPPPPIQGIFGDWGAGNGLLYEPQMPNNPFQYESQGFDYTPKPFEYERQPFNYEPQTFSYTPFQFK